MVKRIGIEVQLRLKVDECDGYSTKNIKGNKNSYVEKFFTKLTL